jgi:hypothetical protein
MKTALSNCKKWLDSVKLNSKLESNMAFKEKMPVIVLIGNWYCGS